MMRCGAEQVLKEPSTIQLFFGFLDVERCGTMVNDGERDAGPKPEKVWGQVLMRMGSGRKRCSRDAKSEGDAEAGYEDVGEGDGADVDGEGDGARKMLARCWYDAMSVVLALVQSGRTVL